MQQLSTLDTIYVSPYATDIRPDYRPAEEALLLGSPSNEHLTYGVGYNSRLQRKAMRLPYFKTGKGTPYKTWHNMLRRCYHGQQASYDGCNVCREWHDYQVFAAWYVEQTYAGMSDSELDKDILDPLNALYSPEHCILVPKSINLLFKDSRKRRGILPRGVSVHASGIGFVARISKHGKSTELGRFDNPHDAFDAYKQARQAYGKELAEQYAGRVDARVIAHLNSLSAHIRD